MKNRILVVAVHADDETLGCGGTLLKHKANGDKIHWLICTTLNKNHDYYQNREKEINKVSKLFNFDSVHNLQFETTKIDQYNMNEIIENEQHNIESGKVLDISEDKILVKTYDGAIKIIRHEFKKLPNVGEYL